MKDHSNPAKTHASHEPLPPMDRRHFVRLSALATASAVAASPLRGHAALLGQETPAGAVPATLSIQQQQIPNTVRLDPSFASLSFEKSTIYASPVYLGAGNTDLIALLNALGSGVLRIGANSVDRTTWTPDGSGQTSGQVAPSDIANFASLIHQCPNWKVIYGVNFRGNSGSTASPALAAGEAAIAAQQLGSQLLGFEIGNEPDLYRNGLTYDIFLNGGTLPDGTAVAGWTAFAKAIHSAVPGAVLTGPAASSDKAGWAEDFAASEAGNIALLTEHYYVSNYSSAAPSIPGLLTYPGPGLVSALEHLQSASQSSGIPFRIDECNSYFASKKPAGVANAFAAALWAIDFIFTNAQYGSSGVNFHNTGNTAGYAAIGESHSIVTAVQPLYYGLFLFSQIFAQGASGVLLESALDASGVALSAFAVGIPGGTCVVLNNKDTANAATVTITGSAHSTGRAFVTTLASAGDTPADQLANLGVYNGGGPITFGGQPVTLNGEWNARPIQVPVSDGTVTVTVAPATATLIRIR